MSQPNTRAFKRSAYAHLAKVGKALASPARLEILDILAQMPRSVEEIAGEIGQSVANTSHHLQTLKAASLAVGQRDGVHIIYSLAGPDVARLVSQLQAVAAQHTAALQALTRDFFEARDGLEALDREALMAHLQAGDAVLVDVRPTQEYEAGHFPGALSIPLDTLAARLAELPRDRTIVAYCRGPYCALSAEAARRLRDLGYDARRADVSVHDQPLEGGASA